MLLDHVGVSMLTTRALGLISLLILSVAVLAPAAYSQVLYGSLTGSVTDSSGAGVPAAKVEATNTLTGVVKLASTDDRGIYQFNDLQPGVYRVTISAPSFSTVV